MLAAAVDPELAGDEATRVRERLARAGLPAPTSPHARRRPSKAAVEVPAALWRKERLGELGSADAEVLVAAFEADYHGTDREPPAFAAVALAPAVLETAAQVTATHAVRAYDAVQLACALAAREADPGCTDFTCFDDGLRAAAARSGFGLIPA